MGEELFFTNSKGQRLCGILGRVNESKELVILVHGYASSKETSSSKMLAKELCKRSINSFRIDLDGCGESEGRFEEQTISSAVNDVLAAIECMHNKGFESLHLFGNSMGGIAVMLAVLKVPTIKSLALKAPVSHYAEQKLLTKGQQWIDSWKQQGFREFHSRDKGVLKIPYSFYEDAQKYNMREEAQNITCPILLIHGDKDEMIPLEQSQKLATLFPNCELIVLEAANHGLAINGDRSKGNELFAKWFERELKG